MFIATNIAAVNAIYHFRNAFTSAETVFRFFMQRFVFWANIQLATIKALLRSLNNYAAEYISIHCERRVWAASISKMHF